MQESGTIRQTTNSAKEQTQLEINNCKSLQVNFGERVAIKSLGRSKLFLRAVS